MCIRDRLAGEVVVLDSGLLHDHPRASVDQFLVGELAYAHTGAMVNIYALGVGAEKFRGVFDNTEIYHKLAELTGVQ